MKNLLLSILFLSVVSLQSFASNNPEASIKIIENNTAEVSLSNADQMKLFTLAQFDQTENRLEFETKDEIKYVQIFDNDMNLQFQLMINSKKVKLSKSLFGEGSFKLGFILDGKAEVEFTNVNMK